MISSAFKRFYRFLLLLVFIVAVVNAQQPAFYNDIQSFKKKDAEKMPAKHSILFVGSSSFTKWTDVQDYFPGYTIINRGFGGSSFPDLIRYADDIIFSYQPAQIFIYCGDNDLAASDTVTGLTVFNRFKQLFDLIRKKMPAENIVFVSIKPSPSRQKLIPKMETANTLIKEFISSQKNSSFVDVYHKMLYSDGTPIKEIFMEDNLHMNAQGYAIWQKAIKPFLIKSLKK